MNHAAAAPWSGCTAGLPAHEDALPIAVARCHIAMVLRKGLAGLQAGEREIATPDSIGDFSPDCNPHMRAVSHLATDRFEIKASAAMQRKRGVVRKPLFKALQPQGQPQGANRIERGEPVHSAMIMMDLMKPNMKPPPSMTAALLRPSC